MWQLVPNLVSIISFLLFTILGNELSVSVAFTVSDSEDYRGASDKDVLGHPSL